MYKMVLRIFACFLVLFGASVVCAANPDEQPQTYAIEITPGKKILHIEPLKLHPGTILSEIIDFFPELLTREENNRFEKYDIQINGISTSGSGEDMLSLILAQDVEKIEVSQSPSMTEQVNGQGAVINIITKQLPEGFDGNVSLIANSLFRAKPSANLNYRKESLSIRGSLLFDYYRPFFQEFTTESFDRNMEQFPYSKREHISNRVDTVNRRSGYELARLQMDYKPDSNHSLKVWFWERYFKESINENSTNITPIVYYEKENLKNDRFELNTGAEYERKYEQSILTTKLSYSFNPSGQYYDVTTFPRRLANGINNKKHDHSISGFTKWAYRFKSVPDPDKLEIIPGVNYEYTANNNDYNEQTYLNGDPFNFTSYSGMLYLSPYLESTYNINQFQFNVGFRYQFFNTSAKIASELFYNQNNSDASAFIKFGWQIAPHHYVNTIFERINQRPAANQTYPFKIYDPGIRGYVQGNTGLLPLGIHNATLNYITDFSKGGHSFVASTSLQYLKVSDVICTTMTSQYQSYINNGSKDILTANAMLQYDYGIFSVSLDGNVFQNWSCIAGNKDKYFYYNISLEPMLSFKKGWRLTPRITYHSNVLTNLSSMGDFLFAKMNVSKLLGNLTLYAEFQDIFHNDVEDWQLKGETIHTKVHSLCYPCLQLGLVLKM